MARFYPTIDDDFHGSDGEIQVYQALQQLSDGYVVFHSFRWLGEPGQYRSEGEGDFIIFHPTKGILSIEVKSGGIGYEEGSWIQINRRNNSKKTHQSLRTGCGNAVPYPADPAPAFPL